MVFFTTPSRSEFLIFVFAPLVLNLENSSAVPFLNASSDSILNKPCAVDGECEQSIWNSMCSEDNVCVCRGNGKLVLLSDALLKCQGKQFGDECNDDDECAFKWATCDPNKRRCQCQAELTATDHIDKCGSGRKVNEECFFDEQCEQELFDTVCLDKKCSCKTGKRPITNDNDKSITCVVTEEPEVKNTNDTSMIVVLSVMCLMFIIICVVLNLFSRARWRENRTIFNTPNPRLMNVSLLRDKTDERRSSKDGSVRELASRESSMASLRQHTSFMDKYSVPQCPKLNV